MKTTLATMFCAVGLSALAVFATYNKSVSTSVVVTKKPTVKPKEVLAKKKQPVAIQQTSLPNAVTNVVAPDYELTIYGAFAFVPEDSTSNFMKTDSGHQFVVLDMAVENTSNKKIVDIGKILLSATVTDLEGNIYPRNALAIEAYEIQYPEHRHKAEYNAMKGKIKPGAYYRTTAYGFEAPEDVKEFLISLPEADKFSKNSKVQTAAFSVE